MRIGRRAGEIRIGAGLIVTLLMLYHDKQHEANIARCNQIRRDPPTIGALTKLSWAHSEPAFEGAANRPSATR